MQATGRRAFAPGPTEWEGKAILGSVSFPHLGDVPLRPLAGGSSPTRKGRAIPPKSSYASWQPWVAAASSTIFL